jgi:hypothetical protein
VTSNHIYRVSLLLLLCAMLGRVADAAPGWQFHPTQFAASAPSIAALPNGQFAVAVTDGNGVHYLEYDGASWSAPQPVDSQGQDATLAILPDGRPIVAYDADGELRVAIRDGSGWDIDVVDPSVAIAPGQWIASSPVTGQPAIAYAGPLNQYLRYQEWDGVQWNEQSVDIGPQAAFYPQLAYAANGVPHIAYYDQDVYDLRWAYRGPSGWQRQTIDSAGRVGQVPRIALLDGRWPVIAYENLDTGKLKVAWQQPTGWQLLTVTASNNIDLGKGVVALRDGNPLVTFSDGLTRDSTLKQAWWTGSGWDVDPIGPQTGQLHSVTLLGSGQPAVAYREAGGVTVAVWHWDALPAIHQQPAGMSVCPGEKVLLRVVASGDGPLTYQWTQDGAAVPGATSTELDLGAVTLSDAGSYRVFVTGALGAVPSDSALVNVIAPPAVPSNVQATPASVELGQAVTLSADAGGAVVEWFTDACAGQFIGTGASLVHVPTHDTTFYARAYDAGTGCSSAACSSVSVDVTQAWGTWQLGYGRGPSFGGLAQNVTALAVFDDGTERALYVGGEFTSLGGQPALHLARWNGQDWRAVGSGLDAGGGTVRVRDMLVFDDGNGPALFIAGQFTLASGVSVSHIARFDGQNWSHLAGGVSGGSDTQVYALAVHDDGTGPALYAAGDFTQAGGTTANHLAKWDGAAWSAVGSGLDQPALAVASVDLGAGPRLAVGGGFTSAGGVPANLVALWDGNTWSALGAGLSGANAQVRDLVGFDDGTGPALYVTGVFANADGVPANGIARWDGTAWSGFGSGLSGGIAPTSIGWDLEVYDGGSDPSLVLAGNFEAINGAPAPHVAYLSNGTWQPLGGGADAPLLTLATGDIGRGATLFAGGGFTSISGVSAQGLAQWDGSGWGALGAQINGIVQTLAAVAYQGHNVLLAGGSFTIAGWDSSAYEAALWDGSGWRALQAEQTPPLSGNVAAFAVFDDGSGPAIYAAGELAVLGLTGQHLARLDPQSREWEVVGGGTDGPIYDLAVYDDGGGAALYLTGVFESAGGVAASRIARWDGKSFTPLAAGLTGGGLPAGYCLEVDTTGTQPVLLVGGSFTTAGSANALNVAAWNGQSWSNVGTTNGSGLVRDLAHFDFGSGPELVAVGTFTGIGGVAAHYIAAWDGTAWHPVTTGANDGAIHEVAAVDLGYGPRLVVVGEFDTFDGEPMARTAAFDGHSWRPMATGLAGTGYAVASYAAHGCTAVHVGGLFDEAGGLTSTNIAEWRELPAIAVQPASQMVCPGDDTTFDVTAVDPAGVSYQWYKDGSALPGATGATLNLPGVSSGNVGDYYVTLNDGCGEQQSVTATLALTLEVAILSDPQPAALCAGDPLALSVVADGAGPLSYQWRRDGIDITGATTDTYSLPAAGLADAGLYDVVVTNDCGSVASLPATVDLLGAEIIAQPADAVVDWGGTAVFQVQADVIGPATYQWFMDGEAIVGATGARLTLSDVTPNDVGDYTVEITHGCGTVLSMAATLAVSPERVSPVLPANGATAVPLYVDLDWTFSSGADSYDVYFGTQSNPPFVDNVAFTTWAAPDLLPGARYYWRINTRNAAGVTAGPVWSFTTQVPQLPATPSGPVPADGATAILRTTTLTWQPSARALEYRVWIAPNSPDALTRVGSPLAAEWPVANLLPDTAYFWRVDAINADGQTIGPVWQFTTGIPTDADSTITPPSTGGTTPPVSSPDDNTQEDRDEDPIAGPTTTGLCPAASAGLIGFTVVGLWRGRRGRHNVTS